jgi:hypothetical protein
MCRELQPVKKGLLLAAKGIGYAVLGTVLLVVFSPVLLLLLAYLVLLVAAVLPFLGFCLGLAAVAAFLLHRFIGLPFWLWMIFTGTGAVLFFIAMWASLFGDSSDAASTAGV